MEINSHLFLNFCEQLQNIRSTVVNQKKVILEKLILNYKTDSESLTSMLHLLLPKIDKSKGPYGMKEYTLGRIISKYFKIPTTSENFKKLNVHLYPEIIRKGDYADTVEEAICIYVKEPMAYLSTIEVDAYLLRISTESNSTTIFCELLSKLSLLEIKWLIRIILKEIKIGLSMKDILSIYHPSAGELYEENANLKDIFKKVQTFSDLSILNTTTLFTFVRPMLSLRFNCNLIKSINLIGRYIEEKFDGERFQFHWSNNDYKWFSRTGNEYNRTFEALSLKIANNLTNNVRNVIFDGEMVGYNKQTGKYGTKGYNYDIKKISNRSDFDSCFKIFDILFYNDENITNKPLHERKSILSNIVNDCEGVVLKSQYGVIKKDSEVVHYFNKSIENDWEGLILKDSTSEYTPNGRTEYWIKMKADYFDNVLTELDLVIIGGYYGTGKFGGEIQSYLLAVVDDRGTTKKYISVSTSGLGLTNKESKKLTLFLKRKGPWIKRITNESPEDYIVWGKEKPQVWRHPNDSVILEMKASELHKSSNYVTTHTLRFPRIVKVRYDKPPHDCMTLNEFNALVGDASERIVKLCKRIITIDDLLPVSKKPSKIKCKTTNVKNVSMCSERKDIISVSNKLSGKEFVVMTGTNTCSKKDLEQKILENGGAVKRKIGANTWCIIAGEIDYFVDTLMKKGEQNIIKAEWLLKELIKSDKNLSDWEPLDAYCLTKEYKKKINVTYDRFGDSFTKHVTTESLLEIFKSIQKDVNSF